MLNRLGWILLGFLVLTSGCNQQPMQGEPPADSYSPTAMQLRLDNQPLSVEGARVSPGFWSAAGIRPYLGRIFVPEEYEHRSEVVVLSHELWKQRFGSDPSLIGRVVEIDGSPRTVVGILPTRFQFPGNTALWLPKVPGSD